MCCVFRLPFQKMYVAYILYIYCTDIQVYILRYFVYTYFYLNHSQTVFNIYVMLCGSSKHRAGTLQMLLEWKALICTRNVNHYCDTVSLLYQSVISI